MSNARDILPTINAIIQTTSMIALTFLGTAWGIYLVMGFLSLLSILQLLAASAFFARIVPLEDYEAGDQNITLSFMVNVLYFINCYYIYSLGFVFLAGIFVSQVALSTYTLFLKAIHK